MIIDAHAHLVAPPQLNAHRSNLIVAQGQYGYPLRATISDALLEAAAKSNIDIMDAVGTDVQILSPRPFQLLHGKAHWQDILAWTMDNNDLIARTIKFHPKRFRGVAAIPQKVGTPVEAAFEEIDRCVNDLGFIGILLNPDPSEGTNESPPLGDPYWYPLYEKLIKMDIPFHIHSGNCCNGRESYDEHFINEESLAITSLYKAAIFKRYPELKILISHGGGAIPYQIGRWRSHYQLFGKERMYDNEGPQNFDDILKQFWFDTVLHDEGALKHLFNTVGVDRCLFGTERPGSGGGIDPVSGRPYDDLKPVIEGISGLTAADKEAIFEGNVRKLFSKLDL